MSYAIPLYITSSIDMSQNGNDGYGLYFIDSSSNNITITCTVNNLGNTLYFPFTRVDGSTNTVTFITADGSTINGNSSINIPTYNQFTLYYLNNNWIAPLVQTTL